MPLDGYSFTLQICDVRMSEWRTCHVALMSLDAIVVPS